MDLDGNRIQNTVVVVPDTGGIYHVKRISLPGNRIQCTILETMCSVKLGKRSHHTSTLTLPLPTVPHEEPSR